MRGRFRILVVDDDHNNRRSISRMLGDYGAVINTAANNTQALSRFNQIPYDLVSLDISMPDFDDQPNRLAGINLLEKLRQIEPTLPAIMLTAEDEVTIRTMLKAKNLENVDVFLKNKSAGADLSQKVDQLLNQSKVSLLAAGSSEPVSFKRKNLVNLQGVVSQVDQDGTGHVFIRADEGVQPELLNTHWLTRAAFGKLREEPVDIIGVQHHKFVVISSDQVVFLHDFYRNDVLADKRDLEGLRGEVIDINKALSRHGVRITSANAPEYLTSKKYWQAVTDDNTLLPLNTKVDILGEKENKLRVREHHAVILNETGREVTILEENLLGTLGKVITSINEQSRGSIIIISTEAPQILAQEHWQATADDDSIFIPGEKVEVIGVKDKALVVQEYRTE